MKFIYLTPFAATIVNATRSHAREFDIGAYDDFNSFYGGY